jgi:glycosyltransferase involved in cell wall biosynthesis
VSALPVIVPATGRRELSILAAARSLPFHSIGGMQAIAWDVLAGLAARGHRVTALTTAILGRSNAGFEHDGVRVVPLAGTVPERYTAGFWSASRAYAETHAAGVDAVLGVSAAAAGLVPLKRSALAVPFVLQVHGSAWAEALAKWRSGRPVEWAKSAKNVYWIAKDARLYRAYDELVFVGDALERQFERAPLNWMTHGIPRTTIANGVDTRRFRFDAAQRATVRSRLGFQARDRVLVFAARLHASKGAAETLRALATLRGRDRSYKLLVIGDGPELPALRTLAGALGCADAVAFAGGVRRDEVPALLAAGNAFVFPPLGGREGLPLNVLEALAVGLPCVCSDELRDVFGELPQIAYAAAHDREALAAAIDGVCLGTVPAGSLLPEQYSLERCVDGYEAVIRRRARR